MALLVYRYLSNAASFFVTICHVTDHENLLQYSPFVKKTCIRQVVLDKLFPLMSAANYRREKGGGSTEHGAQSRVYRQYICVYIYTAYMYIYIYICMF